MQHEVHRFALGDFTCWAINDGDHTYAPPNFPPPAVLLFGGVSSAELRPVLGQHDLDAETWTQWTSPYTCLLINTGSNNVLIDTGTGGFLPGTGQLASTLLSMGVGPADIDTVVLTHGHPDHLGGCVDEQGRPRFPKARYVMSQAEYEFWTSDEQTRAVDEHVREVLVGVARRNLEPLGSQLDLIAGETDIVPGVRALPAPGHTPGLISVAVTSSGSELFCLSDMVLHPIQVEHPRFCGLVDVSHEMLAQTRQRLFERVARKGALALCFHFPFPGLGRISQHEGRWQWRVEAAS